MKETLDSEGDFEDDDESFESAGSGYSPEAEDAGTFWCPKCGAEMYGDAARCAACGDYVTPGARSSTRTPWWIWAGLLLVGLALLAVLLVSFLH